MRRTRAFYAKHQPIPQVIPELQRHDAIFGALSGKDEKDASSSCHDPEALDCTGDGFLVVLYNSPFAQSISSILNFKLSVERSAQPQPLQDVLLHP